MNLAIRFTQGRLHCQVKIVEMSLRETLYHHHLVVVRWAYASSQTIVGPNVSQVSICKGVCLIEVHTSIKHPSLLLYTHIQKTKMLGELTLSS
jgi:hypothetical protein